LTLPEEPDNFPWNPKGRKGEMDKRKKKYLMGIAIIIILAGGFLFYQLTGRNGTSQKFRSVKVERGDIAFVVTATGYDQSCQSMFWRILSLISRNRRATRK
jgi:hypothetical protein